jgi:hypothetical protein
MNRKKCLKTVKIMVELGQSNDWKQAVLFGLRGIWRFCLYLEKLVPLAIGMFLSNWLASHLSSDTYQRFATLGSST